MTASPFEHMLRADDLGAQVFWKTMIYGPTGSGKTAFAAKFKKPLVMLTEPQGLATIQDVNKEAVPVQSKKTGQAWVDSVEGLTAFRAMLRSPDLPHIFDAIVIDSLTEVQRIYKDLRQRQYEAHLAADGKENDFWVFQRILVDMMSFCRDVRNAPVHAACICLERVDKDKKGNVLKTMPELEGGIRTQIGQFFNTVGFMQVTRRAQGLRHEVIFRAGHKFETKTMPAFDDLECPEPLYLLNKRFGGELSEDVEMRVAEWRKLDEEEDEEDED